MDAGLDSSAYGLHARSVCDTKAPLQLHLRLGALYQCYVPLRCTTVELFSWFVVTVCPVAMRCYAIRVYG